MKYIPIILGILLFGNCSLMKKTSKITDESYLKMSNERDRETVISGNAAKNKQQLIYTKDSSGADYKIQFWPRGKLDLSLAGQISGEFDSITINGKYQQTKSGLHSLNSKEVESNRITDKDRQIQRHDIGNNKVQKIATPDGKLICILVITVLVMGYLLIKRLSSR